MVFTYKKLLNFRSPHLWIFFSD